MSTKDHDLSLRGKLATFNSSISKHDNQQYRNLNLNEIHQSSKIDPIFQSSESNSFKNDKRNFDDYNNTKANLNSFNKNQKSSQNLLSLFTDAVKEEKENRWKKKDAKKNKSNDSTLSLHISAYENSIEATAAASADSNRDIKDGDKGLLKTLKNAKFSLTSSTPKMPSPFEIPRQQKDQKRDPEVMQFKASQKLANPNTTGSAPNEIVSPSDYITRACLGQTAQIGDIYDVRNEQLLHGINIFTTTKLPDDIVTRTKTGSSNSDFTLSSKITDKLDALNLHGELSVSFLAGLIKGSGALDYINENVNTKEAVQCTFIQRIRTYDDKININDKKLKGLVASNIGEFGGTHVVVGISWGANAAVTMTYFNSHEESKKNVNGRLKLACSVFKLVKVQGEGVGNYDEKDLESINGLTLKVNADVYPSGYETPLNLKDAMKFICNFTQAFKEENVEGKQMVLHLLPIKVVQEVFKFQKIYHRILFQLEMSTINRLGQLFNEVNESSALLQSLKKFVTDNEEFVATEDKEAIRNFENEFDVAVAKFRTELGILLPKVRSQETESYEIEILRETFKKDSIASSSKVLGFVDSYKHLQEKLDFIKDCKARNILTITETTQLANIKINHQDTEIYMLFASFKKDSLLPQWTENIKYFFDLQKQPAENVLAIADGTSETSQNTATNEKLVLAIVDADVLPNIAKNESLSDGIRIAKYFNGQYISDDCLEFQKKLDSQCLVKCGNIHHNFNKISITAVPINFPCPKSLGYGKCSKGNKEWFCSNCGQQIVYNFDENFYCGCGYNAVKELAFKCCDPNHGSDYASFTESTLNSLLMNVKRLPEINILVIGETGVGKSTWINALANYITHNTTDEVLRNEVINLIATEFQINEEENGELVERSLRVGTSDNENFTKGQSSTQQPKAYVFRHNNTLYRIIDTPGIGDVRGIEQDKKNMENIMQFISKYKEIHGICILMKPNEARLTPSFEWCFKKLLQDFHRSAVENIVFCFNQTSGFNFKVAQTLTPLGELLKEIKETRQITIPKTVERMYSFDNMAYRYLCAVKHHNVVFSQDQEELYKKAYNISKEVTQKMLDYFLNRKPHNVADSLSVYRARNIIQELTKPLALCNTAVDDNVRKIENKQKLIQKYKNDIPELRKVLTRNIEYTRWIMECKDQYYCGNKTCVEIKYYHGDDRLKFLEAYPNVMDEDPFVIPCPQHILKGTNDKCPACGPNTEVKCSNEWICEKKEEKKEKDPNVAAQLKEKLKTQEGIQKEIDKVQQEKDEFIVEKNAIIKASARFAHFMKKNSFILTNDATEKYLKLLIETEKTMGDESKQKALEKLLSQYEAEKMVLEQQLKNASELGDKTITTSDIMELLEDLKKLKHEGRNIASIIAKCDKAIINDATAAETEVELPNQRQSS